MYIGFGGKRGLPGEFVAVKVIQTYEVLKNLQDYTDEYPCPYRQGIFCVGRNYSQF